MAMLYIKQKGELKHTETFLNKLLKIDYLSVLDKYGRIGVEGLKSATPRDTGKTAESWYYEIRKDDKKGAVSLVFLNSNVVKGVPIAIILQYGHGTRNGGYVQGRDYINPVVRPLFDEIASKIWMEVKAK